MPRYFFDVHDDVDIVDTQGQDLPDLKAARHMAVQALTEAARDILPDDGPAKELVVVVRQDGKIVLRARLNFSTDPEI